MVAGIPGAETSGPEGQRAEPAGDTPPSVAHKRSTLKAMLPALALAVIGLALLAGTYILHPRAAGLPVSPPARAGGGEDRMSGIPSTEDSGPEGQRARPAGDTPPSVAHKRSTLKAMLPALALAVIGLALLAGAYILYPRASELPTPPYSTLAVSAAFPIFGLTYAAEPKSSSTTIVTVSVALAAGTTSAHAVHLGVQMPFGTAFWDCTGRTCKPRGKPIQGAWGQALAFSSAGQASAKFFVKAVNFGETSNGVNAAAAIPAVYDEARGHPVLITAYRIASAGSYDWASFPPALARGDAGVWNEPLVRGYTPGRAAVGIDHAAQSHDDFMNLLVGALVGLGGAAILAAVVEAVHIGDWDVIRALRPR